MSGYEVAFVVVALVLAFVLVCLYCKSVFNDVRW